MNNQISFISCFPTMQIPKKLEIRSHVRMGDATTILAMKLNNVIEYLEHQESLPASENQNAGDNDLGWIDDCAIAIQEYRNEEGSRRTTVGIEDIITRHYKNR